MLLIIRPSDGTNDYSNLEVVMDINDISRICINWNVIWTHLISTSDKEDSWESLGLQEDQTSQS